MKFVLLVLSYLAVFGLGFGLGVYLLPILTAPPAPTAAQVTAVASNALYHGEFKRSLRGSDAFHWGEGRVTVSPTAVALAGSVAPGPAYKLYLAPEFVEDEESFLRIKARSLQAGDIRTFENFIVPLPAGTRPEQFTTVVVWCEAFSRFITAARYR